MSVASNTKPGYGSIRADEVLPLREAARRLGWGQRTIRRAQKEGLRVVKFSTFKYVRGEDLVAFFNRLATEADT